MQSRYLPTWDQAIQLSGGLGRKLRAIKWLCFSDAVRTRNLPANVRPDLMRAGIRRELRPIQWRIDTDSSFGRILRAIQRFKQSDCMPSRNISEIDRTDLLNKR